MVTSVTNLAQYPWYVNCADYGLIQVELAKALVGITFTVLILTCGVVFIWRIIVSHLDFKVTHFSRFVDLHICSFHLDLIDVELFWSSLLLLFFTNGW